ncbi:cardiolipin synthase [Aquiflexum sp. LQ15W]|uniref:cardiolipin synthase n=1 Tax=Cognataquiflexum nitidum TaxID=2922272 RepID=UPI001F1347D3|nr:cardiolipin synthase [Cognataquiflexum nitidum]MCH6198373.1 cardiolipin synthase [Cognataquiflexum nitidum]
MDWIIIFQSLYIILLVSVCLRIIYDTENSSKTLSYLMLAIFVPFLGILFYLFFGINFRKRNIFKKKLLADNVKIKELNHKIILHAQKTLEANKEEIKYGAGLVKLLVNDSHNPLTDGNQVTLLNNGEEKFPEVIESIKKAKHHIHLEYYIFENDTLGNQIKDLLIQKAKEGIEIRFIFDDFGGKNIRGKFADELRNAGIEVFAFNKIKVFLLASKMNYRNHRKILVIDGKIGFVGGINVCDKYINSMSQKNLFWRDSHLKIEGPAVLHLQHIFLSDWNFCSGQKIQLDSVYFDNQFEDSLTGSAVQIVAGGPDNARAIIMLSMLKAINLARNKLFITTPYFIPDQSIVNALKVAALSGVDVRILVPGISDSLTVNAAARSHYGELLKAGIQVFLYEKGFVHAKTMVIDDLIGVVGTANMDIRSFDINFEVNVNIFDSGIAKELTDSFMKDLEFAKKLNSGDWEKRPFYLEFPERIARLLSPVL